MASSHFPSGSPTPDDLQRNAFMDAAVEIGALEGESAITMESVAKGARVPQAAVEAMFVDAQSIIDAIPAYLTERKAGYIQAATAPQEGLQASAYQRLVALCDGYFSYIEEDPRVFHYVFERYGGVTDEVLRLAREGKPSGNSSIDAMIKLVTDFALECGAEIGVTTTTQCIAGQAINIWSAVHGMGHLCTRGVLRHQNKVVRRYTFNAVLNTTLSAVSEFFTNRGAIEVPGIYDELLPIALSLDEGRLDYTQIDFTQNEDEELLRRAVIEAAIDIVGAEGPDALRISRVAELLGLPEARVAHAAENEFVLRENMELGTDHEVAVGVSKLIELLPQECTALDRLRAFGTAYFLYAVGDPTRYNAMIMTASGSVVPNTTGGQHAEMSGSYQAYIDLACGAMQEAGIELTDYQVYIRSIIAWASGDGIAHLCALGDLQGISQETKWRLFGQVSELIMDTFSEDLPEQLGVFR